ncbi:TIGR00269 family protein [Methanoplanus endosymbiosus]|uniref:TIGR00269 family protein n=1 Tax=Methanoplanus endosymbiosus TaxID=33865 RepID=A0A9E7PK41_9EURY|nr:TIGR00269 family protein [Methanoplanus endosymbiosus]UUX91490.1 TIGR00269 family protein [Methanoplanus endosymbiosus]
MKCSKCRQDAVLFQRYSGLHLCEDHFTIDLETKVKKTIRKEGWIKSGDKIAVALSGGKDSTALLYFLTKTFGIRRDVEIAAVTIDEGISGYRSTQICKSIAEQAGVEFHTASFKEHFGITLDEIVQKKGDINSCSYCGVLRRQLLNRTARDAGATKIAYGFNLDDEAQSVMMNVLRGDAETLLRKQKPVEGMLPRIKPFKTIPEREVALYARLQTTGYEERGCPYSYNALRADVRGILNQYNYGHPATKYALLNLGEKFKSGIPADSTGAETCATCGEPVFGSCRVCGILKELKGE